MDDRYESTRMGSARDSNSDRSTLPAIGSGGSHPLVPAPPPAIASKSRLKPPSQRTTLLSSLTNNGINTSSDASLLRLPSLVKPSVASSKPVEPTPGNQEAELEVRTVVGSSRSSLSNGPRGSAVDKHRDFIKDLEEQKRKEKEAQAQQDRRRRKLQKKLAEKILQEAAEARHKQEDDNPAALTGPEDHPEGGEAEDATGNDDAKRQRDKDAKRQRKRLLKKQQLLLETLQTKQREKHDELELDKARERRRQHKLKKAVLAAIHASRIEGETMDEEIEVVECKDDASDCKPSLEETVPEEMEEMEEETVAVDNQSNEIGGNMRHRKNGEKPTKRQNGERDASEADLSTHGLTLAETCETAASMSVTPPRTKEKREALPPPTDSTDPPNRPKDKDKPTDAVHKKQHEYLAKLAEQRRLKQKDDDDAKLVQEKRRKRVQLEAQQRLHEAAAKAQQQRLLEEQQHQATGPDPDEEKKAVVDVHAMVARLSKLKDKDVQVIPEARDFASWKKRHGVRRDQKVFSMTGWYPVIRTALEARGWFYNEERGSPFFDFKWSLKSDDLKTSKLKEEQFVNHFFANTAITTKVGLLHTLRSLSWHHSVDVDTVFPRAYDLNEPRDMDAFTMDFRSTFAEGVLKHVVDRISSHSPLVQLNEAVIAVLLSVGRRKLRTKRVLGGVKGDGEGGGEETLDSIPSLQYPSSLDPLEESVDETLSGGAEDPVSELEWEVLTKHQLEAPGKFRASLVYKKRVVVDAEKDPTNMPGEGSTPPPMGVDTVVSALEKKQQRQLEKRKAEAFEREKTILNDCLGRVSVPTSATCAQLRHLTTTLSQVCPQFALNGSPSRNIWIVKPAGLSRGRGIRVFNDLSALLAYADVEHHKECQWVAQKYIENPLLLCERKFDIRQWVLVTSWDPLTIWMYDDFYLRFSSEPYSTDDLSDQYVHLTNNSIQKHADKFSEVYSSKEDPAVRVEGNMLHSDEFKAHLQRTRGLTEAALEQTLHARMREIVCQSLQCASDLVQHRRNACELYGYDFMLDDTLRPWLIEVNSSPACDYSTPTAQRYVETGLDGIVQIVVDHREYELRKKNGVTNEVEPPTSKWRRIHKGDVVGKPVAAFGADFQVKGTKVQRTRGKPKVTVKVDKGPDEELPGEDLETLDHAEEVDAVTVVETADDVADQEEEDEDSNATSVDPLL